MNIYQHSNLKAFFGQEGASTETTEKQKKKPQHPIKNSTVINKVNTEASQTGGKPDCETYSGNISRSCIDIQNIKNQISDSQDYQQLSQKEPQSVSEVSQQNQQHHLQHEHGNDEGFHELDNKDDDDDDVFYSAADEIKLTVGSAITDYCKETKVSDLIDWLDKDDGHKQILMSFFETLNLTDLDSSSEKYTKILLDKCSWQQIDTLKIIMQSKLNSDQIDTVDKTKKILMNIYLTEVSKYYKTVSDLIIAFEDCKFLSAVTFLKEELPKAMESIQK
ncbi:hypothetical protein [Endozoicomonas sp.]|uniref:hypothetical protein n=1 Tax=Endozoicomonas sp. TaxID=1892382 RepID=UPI0028864233|nr:hypothetical protein [Endozoicomonas sp.]